MQTAYVLVSPCKDEAKYIEKTLRSIARQTVKPVQWVIVDDGSRDDSMAIVAQYQSEMPFIKVVHRDTGARSVGPGVIQAFNAGLAAVDVPHDFLCKFDVDLELPERYFEIMLARMAADPRLGTFSGKPCYHNRAGAPRPRALRRRELGRDDQVLPPRRLRRDRRLRRRERLGHARRPHGALARLARRQPRRGRDPLRPPARHGIEPEEPAPRPRPPRRGPVAASARTRCSSPPPRSTGSRSRRPSPARCGSPWATCAPRSRGTPRLGDADFTRFLRRYQLRALRTGKREAAEWAFRERDRALAPDREARTPHRSRPDRMILSQPRLAALRELAADVTVIGSGPVGIVTALALADRGFRVLVLESGGAGPEPAADDLAGRREPDPRPAISSRTPPSPAASAAPRTSGPGAACPSTPSTSAPAPGSGSTPPGRSARATSRRTSPRRSPRSGQGRRSSPPRCPASPPMRRSAATRSSAGRTSPASTSSTPRPSPNGRT